MLLHLPLHVNTTGGSFITLLDSGYTLPVALAELGKLLLDFVTFCTQWALHQPHAAQAVKYSWHHNRQFALFLFNRLSIYSSPAVQHIWPHCLSWADTPQPDVLFIVAQETEQVMGDQIPRGQVAPPRVFRSNKTQACCQHLQHLWPSVVSLPLAVILSKTGHTLDCTVWLINSHNTARLFPQTGWALGHCYKELSSTSSVRSTPHSYKTTVALALPHPVCVDEVHSHKLLQKLNETVWGEKVGGGGRGEK